jgi:hypothetical protein
MLKTKTFEQSLNKNENELKLYENKEIKLLGSYKNNKHFISDIDYTLVVYFDKELIKRLYNMISKLKNFYFIYLGTESIKELEVPWNINFQYKEPYDKYICNFNLEKAIEWVKNIQKVKNKIPEDKYKKIYNIINQDTLILADLIKIQEILEPYSTIKWYLDDIKKGKKIINNVEYDLLEELKNIKSSNVLNMIYTGNENKLVNVDVGLVDYKYKKPIYHRLYKFYMEDLYKILKGYKKLINKEYNGEYREVMIKFELINSLLGQVKLLNQLKEYNIFQTNWPTIEKNIKFYLDKKRYLQGTEKTTQDIEETLEKRLNEGSKLYIDYFLNKLTNHGKIQMINTLRLLIVSQKKIDNKTLIDRNNKNIECPFFNNEIDEMLNKIGNNLLLNTNEINNFKYCIYKVIPNQNNIKNYFDLTPISRLMLYKKQKITILTGEFKDEDIIFLNNITGNNKNQNNEYKDWVINDNLLNNIKLYLISPTNLISNGNKII